MQKAMSLEALLTEVKRQSDVKRDFITKTNDQIRLVETKTQDREIVAELLVSSADKLERLKVSDKAHQQIATWLKIPSRYYFRLLNDHPDLIVTQVNELFAREPGRRMCRVLDGTIRAFLSDRYARIDNEEVLSNTLPTIINGNVPTQMLASNVTADRMDVKVLFTGDDLAHEVAKANCEPRIIRPGFRMSNSETGGGSVSIDTFFYDSYCTNGCVFGREDIFSFKRRHLGAAIDQNAIAANLEIVSEKTKALENELILSQITDAVSALSNPQQVERMANHLRDAASTDPVKNPVAAVDAVAKEITLREPERDRMLEVFLRDRDFTKWGMASAVTEIANDDQLATFSRACELEDIGGKLLNLNDNQWQKFVKAEKIVA